MVNKRSKKNKTRINKRIDEIREIIIKIRKDPEAMKQVGELIVNC
jgi:hypothetical protein